jgi:diadenosine tetraphosphate (Ap4A) HIT family hydrolase
VFVGSFSRTRAAHGSFPQRRASSDPAARVPFRITMRIPRHPSFDASCGVCLSLSGPAPTTPIYEDDLWHVRHMDPAGVPGWMLMITQRHVGGPAHFDDREAASLGPALRHFSRVLEQVTGALRIYTAAMGESFPHFHAHLVPRYREMPRDAKAWSVFDLQRAVAAGELSVDPDAVRRVTEEYRAALIAAPPPRTV